MVFNLWGFPFISLVPVFAKDIMQLSDTATGLLVSAEGIGAFVGALALSVFAPAQNARRLYTLGVVCYCLAALTFAQVDAIGLAALALLIVGLMSAGFGAMQSALVLINSPSSLTSNMMGVLAVCIGTAPIGFLHIGLMADWFGTSAAATITAIEGILAMLVVSWRWPVLWSAQTMQTTAR